MSKGEKDHGEYVRKVQQETQRYSQDLLEENDRLRLRLAAVETERELEAAELRRRLQTAESESKRFSVGYAEIERQNSNLANLYVASYRLHGTLDRGELVLALQEIVANLVGCEEMGIFELAPEARVLRLVGSFGISSEEYAELPLAPGLIGASAATGEAFVAPKGEEERSPLEANLTACIPLTVEGRVTGVIALFRLLSHKDHLAEIDHELFDLLAAQAGLALYCTKLHAERQGDSGGGRS